MHVKISRRYLRGRNVGSILELVQGDIPWSVFTYDLIELHLYIKHTQIEKNNNM